MSFKFGTKEEVVKNRENFLGKLRMQDCVKMDLEQKDHIAIVGKEDRGKGMFDNKGITGDAAISEEPGVFLFLVVADCLPIILCDSQKKVVAQVHVGWHGTDLELTKRVACLMQEKFSCNPANIIVGIGPGIHKESYIRENPSQKDNPAWQPYLEKVDENRFLIDLVGYNKTQLIESGIPEENIEISDIDTATSKEFFSHDRSIRSGEPEGRFAVVAGMI